ncbi:MAG: hypothetical protein MJ216_02055 [Bacilli bacterium]|nr:hypothetical protein [Bacilli bacterium]
MKKTKILSALGILLATSVTACGGGKGSSPSSSEQPPAPSSSQPGSSLNSDSSVNPGTSSVNQNSSSANKSSSSTQSSTPAPLEINAPAHNWGAAQLMDAKAEGQMMYNRFACQDNDGAIKVELEATKGTFGGGATGVKSGTPKGYMKLGSNNNTVTYKFYYNSAAKGTIYQRGMMDAWTSGNSVVTYECYTSSSQSSHRDEGNFDLKVNNKLVDWTAMKDVTCEEFFANGVDSGLGSSYSKMADCTIGAIELVPGENVIEYKRTGSFNFVIKDFVLIVKNEGTPIEDNVHTHQWSEFKTTKEANCKETGSKERTCVCGEKEVQEIPLAPHAFETYRNIPADEALGTINAKAIGCPDCNLGGIEWSAKDYDVELSKEVGASSDGQGVVMSIADKSDPNSQSAGGACVPETVGTRYVYKINSYEAKENVKLAFDILPYNQWGQTVDIFKADPSDWKPGYIDMGEGANPRYVMAENRYGLVINGENAILGEDKLGKQSARDWYEFPVTFNLKEGLNTIEVVCLGGYPAQGIYGYRLLGLNPAEREHIHTLGDWQSDDTNHWKECSGADCPAGANAHINEAAHTFGDQYDVVPATCNSKGSYKVKCSVCNYVKTVETDMLEHAWGEAQTAISDATPHECASCNTMAYDLAVASPTKLKADVTWNIAGLPAGNYEIRLYACASATTLPQKYDSRYQFQIDSGDYIGASDDNATYASYGLGTGEKLENCQWSNAINTIEIGATAASFTLHWTNKGYSAFIAGVRLVKVA